MRRSEPALREAFSQRATPGKRSIPFFRTAMAVQVLAGVAPCQEVQWNSAASIRVPFTSQRTARGSRSSGYLGGYL